MLRSLIIINKLTAQTKQLYAIEYGHGIRNVIAYFISGITLKDYDLSYTKNLFFCLFI